ncbi:uncharacterized protein LOC135374170 [Ornithodoros turicata]|uniref:uncharacterized protein LOC135374170 n=1 Tax=Ornithodoros turicata TaxID=34597 RepID=UPI003138FCF1
MSKTLTAKALRYFEVFGNLMRVKSNVDGIRELHLCGEGQDDPVCEHILRPSPTTPRSNALEKTVVFYTNCTSPVSRARNKAEHVAAVMARFGLTGFPYLGSSEASLDTSVEYITAMMAKELHILPFFDVSIVAVPNRNARKRRTVMFHPSARWGYASPDLEVSYQLLRKSASILPSLQHFSKQHYLCVHNFSTHLAQVRQCSTFSLQQYHTTNLTAFSSYETFNVIEFLNILFSDLREFKPEDSVIVGSKLCFHDLLRFLDDWNDTNAILNYLGTYLWLYLSPALPQVDAENELLPRTPFHPPGIPNRWPLCLRMAQSICPRGMLALLTRVFSQGDNAEDFVAQHQWWMDIIKDTLLQYINRSVLLDDRQRKVFREKIRLLKIYPVVPHHDSTNTSDIRKWKCQYTEDFSMLPPVLHFIEAVAFVGREYWRQLQAGKFQKYSVVDNFAFRIRHYKETNTLCKRTFFFIYMNMSICAGVDDFHITDLTIGSPTRRCSQ